MTIFVGGTGTQGVAPAIGALHPLVPQQKVREVKKKKKNLITFFFCGYALTLLGLTEDKVAQSELDIKV
jgi:hypothetical protein